MKLVTHSGEFHADDVLSAALLTSLYPDAEIVRSRDPEVFNGGDIVFDVGRVYDAKIHRYDHHQQGGAGQRKNGVKYSAFGLIWKHFGLEFCVGDRETWKRIDRQLVQPVDADDNGQAITESIVDDLQPYTAGDFLEEFNNSLSEVKSADECFLEAVSVGKKLLARIEKRTSDKVAGERQFMEIYAKSEDKRYAVLDRYLPVGDLSKVPELLYVIYPYETSAQWMIKAVNKTNGGYESRKPLPKSWRGLDSLELSALTGVDDAIFCHNTGFIGSAKSRQGTLKMLELALAA